MFEIYLKILKKIKNILNSQTNYNKTCIKSFQKTNF